MTTHGGILSATLPCVFENLHFNFVRAHPIEHLSIIKGELKNGRMVCVEYNDAALNYEIPWDPEKANRQTGTAASDSL
jgi:hypothetical protein